MDHQDWNTVVINGKQSTTPKISEGVKRPQGNSHLRKLENETENLHHQKVSHNLAQTIQNSRNEKGWTRAELAQRINVKAGVVADYETGKAIPDGVVLQRLSRALGVTLRKNM